MHLLLLKFRDHVFCFTLQRAFSTTRLLNIYSRYFFPQEFYDFTFCFIDPYENCSYCLIISHMSTNIHSVNTTCSCLMLSLSKDLHSQDIILELQHITMWESLWMICCCKYIRKNLGPKPFALVFILCNVSSRKPFGYPFSFW